MKKLAIITSHPIQYNAPVFRMLAERGKLIPKVFYTWENSQYGIYDQKFKQEIKWDIPLLEGYEYQFVKNTSNNQGTHHRKGLINPALIKEIEQWKPDTVLIFGWNFHSHFKAMKYFKGKIPVYFRGDSTLLNDSPGLKTFLRRIILRFVYRYVDYAIYVGTNNKKYFLKHGLKENQLLYAPHAVDNERFFDNEGEFERMAKLWRNELGITNDDLVFLFAGKFEAKKDPLILLKAARLLEGKKVKFIFAGEGDLKKEMISTSEGLSNIMFLPFQNQTKMPVLYRLANVFVLPSKGPNETWGLAVNESMACGKAVLVSDKVGCSVDLIENGKNGYIFEADNLKDLLDKIGLFTLTKSKEFGNYSKAKIEDYSIINICTGIEDYCTR